MESCQHDILYVSIIRILPLNKGHTRIYLNNGPIILSQVIYSWNKFVDQIMRFLVASGQERNQMGARWVQVHPKKLSSMPKKSQVAYQHSAILPHCMKNFKMPFFIHPKSSWPWIGPSKNVFPETLLDFRGQFQFWFNRTEVHEPYMKVLISGDFMDFAPYIEYSMRVSITSTQELSSQNFRVPKTGIVCSQTIEFNFDLIKQIYLYRMSSSRWRWAD